MSIDRCNIVRNTIKDFLIKNESVVGDSPENDGIYMIIADTSSFTRAASVVAGITQKLTQIGFSFKKIEISENGISFLMIFHVNVGEIRAV